MSGTKEIGFEVNLRVRVNSRRNSPFSSPFFNDPFFGFGREESLTVKLPNKAIEIKPLPASNRPLNFSGAIGKFNAISSIDADQIEVGRSLYVSTLPLKVKVILLQSLLL